MRLWQADVLNTLGNKYTVGNWTEASMLFRRSGKKIMPLCRAALSQDKQEIAGILTKIADTEEQAYIMLKDFE
jgi:hypothetical protein